MPIRLTAVPPAGVAAVLPALRAVYEAAFAGPPYDRPPVAATAFGDALQRHTTYAGFALWVARLTPAADPCGFAYGYTGGSGWWWNQVAPALPPATRGAWAADYFELVELAVAPAAQGRGIGGRLHDLLLASRAERTALLTTHQTETTALTLYRKRGWVTLVAPFFFGGGGDPFRIMGLDLRRVGPALAARAALTPPGFI